MQTKGAISLTWHGDVTGSEAESRERNLWFILLQTNEDVALPLSPWCFIALIVVRLTFYN